MYEQFTSVDISNNQKTMYSLYSISMVQIKPLSKKNLCLFTYLPHTSMVLNDDTPSAIHIWYQIAYTMIINDT